MEKSIEVKRITSCRGVSFEIKPRKASPFEINSIVPEDPNSNWAWPLPAPSRRKGSLSRVFTLSSAIQKSMSRSSSHFCDIHNEDDDYEDEEVDEFDVEKQVPSLVKLPSDIKQQPKKPPAKTGTRLSIILLDQGLFTVYKRLFAICLILNSVGLILATTGKFDYGKKNAVLFSVGNIFALTLCRSEALLRIVFWAAVKIFGWSWVPLPLKTTVTSFLQCLGGVHSGCGVSSIIWLVYALVLTLKDRDSTSSGIIVVASTILVFLCLSSLAAFPLVRHLHHNVFEGTHRFAGWIALALLWLFLFLIASYDPLSKSYHFHGSRLVRKQELWFTAAITVLIILPWVTVKRVPVKVSAPSGHASLIKFGGGVKPGILGRISRSPLSEWHAFGIISDGKEEHMMLAGAVGDFTKGLVSNPPNHLWVRGVQFAGLPYLVNMYERAVLVATGSGICVFLSLLLQPCSEKVCLLWVAKGIEQNFGKEIVGMVSGFPKEKVIVHDTAVLGRPNVGEMSVKAARDWGAQVVVVTSNPEGSRDVVNACKAQRIAAFGPIWDS